MSVRYFVLHTNPEPWAVGEASRVKGGVRIAPNPNLAAFQASVKEELEGVQRLPDSARKLTFFFFRQQARYIDAADRVRQRNQADATNMQKALEDALQGVLFENDREIRDIRSVIVEQGPHVKNPGVIIMVETIGTDYETHARQMIPVGILMELEAQGQIAVYDDWLDGEEEAPF